METKKDLIKFVDAGFNIFPLSKEMLSDYKTPIQVMKTLMGKSVHCFILESATEDKRWSRYTFLGYEPKNMISARNGVISVDGTQIESHSPKEVIENVLRNYKSVKPANLPYFTGGFVGYFAYDYYKYTEPTLKLNAFDSEGFMDVDLMLFDKLIVFDNFEQKINLISNVYLNDLDLDYDRAVDQLNEMKDIVTSPTPEIDLDGKLLSSIKPHFSRDEFCKIVNQAKGYIFEGDIFQVVLSNKLEAEFEGSLFNTYRRLRTINPSPYMFYFSGTDMEVAGASPETLVKVVDGKINTFPLAGTRKRGADDVEDEMLKADLLQDHKELAEHNMLVDLGRNDIGKISEFGSVKVEEYMNIHKYSHVMHIGSTVSGRLRKGLNCLDALGSILPAGTLSGAPKYRAAEIIDELENDRRGIYGGAIGYIDFSGNMDMCIAIRLAYKKNGKIFVRSGAGIVADSNPEKEYDECINKAMAMVSSLEGEKL